MNRREHTANLFAAVRAALAARPAQRPVERALVLGYGAIGDTIFFLPVLMALRRAYPKANMIWVSNPAPVADELLPAMGLVDEVWRWEAQGNDPAGRAAISARVAAGNFDLAVLTLGAPAHHFLSALAGIPVVAGHRRPWRGAKGYVAHGDYARDAVVNRLAAVVPGEHSLTRNLRILSALGIEAPDGTAAPALPVTAAARASAAKLLSGLGGPIIALHLGPTGNQYAKMWAPERFAALSRRLTAERGGSLVLVGAAEEAEAEARFFAAGGAAARSLVGKTGLLEAFAVLERCALLVSNDTGLAKAAAALKTPTVTLWGPTDPAEFRSPWDPGRHADVRTGIACSPCSWMGMTSRPYNYLNCGHHDCLGRLEVEAVAEVLLDRRPPSAKS